MEKAVGTDGDQLAEGANPGFDGRAMVDRILFALADQPDPVVLIIDDLGYLPFETNAAHLFFQLISRRYERGSVLITSNRSVGEWGTVFGDPVVATAIPDRLLHPGCRPR